METKATISRSELVTKLWVYFCLNYPDITDVIKYICKQTGKEWLEGHLRGKFNSDYEICGSYGAMNAFYCDIDEDLRSALVDYCLNVWSPKGMRLSDSERALLQG